MGLMPSASVGEHILYMSQFTVLIRKRQVKYCKSISDRVSAAMMFEDAFGLKRSNIRTAVNKSLEQGIVTEDLKKGTVYKTSDVGLASCQFVGSIRL
jgi:3-isopropylmalate dehydrogenase